MSDGKKRSFWHEPEWHARWRTSSLRLYVIAAGFVLGALLMARKGDYPQAYALFSPFIIAAAAFVVERLVVRSFRTSISCLSIIIATPVVGLAGYLMFGSSLLGYRQSWAARWSPGAGMVLIAASAIAAVWLLLMLVAGREKPKSVRRSACSVCGQLSGLTLLTGPSRKHLCAEHLLEDLRKAVNGYQGRLIIVERDLASRSRQAQYIFYNPEELLEDSYPDGDVEAVKRLIDRLLPASSFAARIPNSAVKEIAKWDDDPLIPGDPERIVGQPLDRAGLMLYLEDVIRAFDAPGSQFQMNLPHGETGIYLWHNYV